MAQLQEFGPYKIVAQLGAGGMGQVYRAHDSRLNRDVALKILPPEFSTDPVRKQRFQQEAKAVAALNHPGIVTVYDVGDGWMATELVDGENLRQTGFTTRQVIDIGAQIAEALAAAHDAGIAHRDLKPENVLLTHDGRTKILDFGLAKVMNPEDRTGKPDNVSTITSPGTPMGTPGYMAPEQVRGQQSDHRADIFSLGVMLHEMLAGRPPFEGESAIDVMHAIVHADPPPLPQGIPAALRAIVTRCLEKKPGQRFQSARDLAFALRSVPVTTLAGDEAQAIKIAAPRTFWAIAVWPLVVMACLALIGVAYYAMRPAPMGTLDSYSFRPFAFTHAQEHSGVWSPDGKTIAYIEQSVSGSRLMVQALEATSPTELVTGILNQPGQVAWSSDGKKIYFLGSGECSGICAISRAGGEPERILPDIAGVTAFHISADGQNLAIWRGVANKDNGQTFSVWISSPPGAAPVEYKQQDFAVKTRFTPVFLRFSPDSKHLVLSRYSDAGAEMWLLPFPSGTPRRLFSNIAWGRPLAASWMPDSRHIVFSGNPSTSVNEQLWMADVESETLTRVLVLPQGAASTPSVSPDGKRILFAQVQRDRDLMEFPLDGSAPHPFLATSLPEWGPSWSPQGDQFAFITERRGSDELWVRSPEGNWDRPIVTLKEFPRLQTLVSPVFSPDGTRIIYTAMLSGEGRRRSLAISPAGGGEPTVISEGYGATWAPDGDRIAFLWLRPDGNLPVATLGVGSDDPPQVLIPAKRGLGAPEWSPDGTWIAAASATGTELVSPDGDKTKTKLIPDLTGTLLWSRDSKTLYGLTFQAAKPHLLAANVATGVVKDLAEYDLTFEPLLENSYTGSVRLSMSPDGKSFVAATSNNQSDLWILDGFAK